LLTLVPLLSPDRYVPTPAERVQMAEAHVSLMSAQLVADGDTKRASEEVEAARIALDRAHRLFADKAGSARDVDDAQARLAVSQKTLESAMARRDGLTHAKLDSESGTLTPMDIVSPVDGLVVALGVAPSQTVAANTALVEVADTSTVWIRVPIYVGQLAEIRPDADVAIGSLRGGADAKTQSAQPIAAPPSADPQSSTVDVFYEMRNKDGALRPGARVGVTLPLVGEEESLVVPWAAILHDIHGSAWLYEKPQAQTYQRRRVEVRHVTGETAVLARGPDVGTEIVVDGAAELFGTEFGAGK
jgi:RND family efflux transporter MFP subunit